MLGILPFRARDFPIFLNAVLLLFLRAECLSPLYVKTSRSFGSRNYNAVFNVTKSSESVLTFSVILSSTFTRFVTTLFFKMVLSHSSQEESRHSNFCYFQFPFLAYSHCCFLHALQCCKSHHISVHLALHCCR